MTNVDLQQERDRILRLLQSLATEYVASRQLARAVAVTTAIERLQAAFQQHPDGLSGADQPHDTGPYTVGLNGTRDRDRRYDSLEAARRYARLLAGEYRRAVIMDRRGQVIEDVTADSLQDRAA